MLQRNRMKSRKSYHRLKSSIDDEKYRISLHFAFASLVLKDYVRKPNSVAWDTNNINAIIVRWVPGEAIISPLLQMTFEIKVISD